MRRARVEKKRDERKTREGFKVSVALISHFTILTHGHRLSYKNSSIRAKPRLERNGRPSTHCSRMTSAASKLSVALAPAP